MKFCWYFAGIDQRILSIGKNQLVNHCFFVVFLHDLALMLPRAFHPGGGLVDGDLSEDNSSSVRALPLLEITASFPLLRIVGSLARSPFLTSLAHPFQVRGFFLPWTATNHFHVVSVQRELVTLHLSRLLLLLPLHLLMPMEELIFKCLMHLIVRHCDCFG